MDNIDLLRHEMSTFDVLNIVKRKKQIWLKVIYSVQHVLLIKLLNCIIIYVSATIFVQTILNTTNVKKSTSGTMRAHWLHCDALNSGSYIKDLTRGSKQEWEQSAVLDLFPAAQKLTQLMDF